MVLALEGATIPSSNTDGIYVFNIDIDKNIDSFGIDKKLINQLDVSKTVPSEVMNISSVIISNLNSKIK